MEKIEHVSICGVPHKIKYCEDAFDLDTHFGQIDYLRCEIRVNDQLKAGALEETLCHEILHGMLVHIGRNDLSQDESFVQALGNAIYQTFSIKQ